MGELREFVYIDDVSLNSHLSSLGKGVPQEVVHTAEDETEKGGEGGGTLWGIGLKGKYSNVDISGVERTLSITEPYRFEDLIEALDEENIEIHQNPDPRSLARGDVVRIEGQAIPMSLFKFEVAVKTIKDLLNAGTQESLEELDAEAQNEFDAEDLGQLDVFDDLLEKFTGDKIPLRIATEDWSYGVTLDRQKMRVPPAEAFIEENDYTLIGRVEQRLISDDRWDPILATSIMDRYMPEEEAPEEMRAQLEVAAEEMNMAIGEEDWELSGHTAVIHPIAIFW